MTLRVAVLLAFALPAVAQDKPKPAPKISIADPAKLRDDIDFALQGEYLGEVALNSGTKKIGAQVLAKGAGQFDVKVFMGGLPGAGGDAKTARKATAKRDGSTVAVSGLNLTGTLTAGKLTLKDGLKLDAELARVERTSPTLGAKPPAGAKVLFAAAGDEANWAGGKLIELSDGKFLNNGIKSKAKFGAVQLHVEFRLPWMPDSFGQARANSGVYLQDRYEVQVLDSFGLEGKNNECGGVYTQYSPSVNMCLPPMVWQTYDIDFVPATFDGEKKTAPAKLTLRHNGVLIHDAVELKGPTGGGQPEANTAGPIQFQNHGNPVVFRNVWAVEVK